MRGWYSEERVRGSSVHIYTSPSVLADSHSPTANHQQTNEQVRTSHFLLTDMDLWPARGMYRLLRRLAAPGAGTRQAFLDPKQVRRG